MNRHEAFQEDIPALIAGRLEEEARTRLEAHLRECRTCADLLASTRALVGAMSEMEEAVPASDVSRGPHPDRKDLRELALGASGPAAAGVTSHIDGCPLCLLEVEAWRALAGPPDVAAGRRRAALPAEGRRRPWRGALAAAAAGLVAGLLLARLTHDLETPAGRTLPDSEAAGSEERQLPAPWTGPVGVLMLGGPLRGDEAALVIPPDHAYVVLAVPLDVPASLLPDAAIEFSIVTEQGRSVWTFALTARRANQQVDASEAILFAVPASAIPEGRYVMRVRFPDSNAAGPQFPFAIHRGR